ncbi:MAG: Histidine kinase, partial [Verrucomicrobiales bacterium]|nr:Histidine kinase [Verrucomicrobiales bacterium]
DITEKKKLESQFLRAQRMESIGTLAGGIAHDLNNVLAPIMMSLELLRDLAHQEKDLMLINTLQESAVRGSELVKQVLSFARGVEGQRITVNPIHIIQDLLKVIRDTFPKSINVRFLPKRELWAVTGDPTQMHQVFLNLCVNSRDAMASGGSLTIEMENVVVDEDFGGLNPESKPGSYVLVSVEDSGSGIPQEIRDRVFEPFFTTKEIGKGTGLGLSTTLAIVRSHGGFITVQSEMGHGTLFKVYLPADTQKMTSGVVNVEASKLPRGNGELVLVVDDEEAVRKIAKRTMERFGYRVLLASNGREALGIYIENKHEIGVVLTDMAMPIMDGPALIIALRSINPNVRIIGSSGLAGVDEISKVAGRVAHYIPKPYTTELILETLKKALAS